MPCVERWKVKTVESCKTFVDNETLVCLCLAYIYSCQLFQNGIRTNLNGKTCARFCLFLFGHKRYYLSDRNFYIQGTAYNGQLNKTYILKFNRFQIIFTFFFILRHCISNLWDLVLGKMYQSWLQKCISNICRRLQRYTNLNIKIFNRFICDIFTHDMFNCRL